MSALKKVQPGSLASYYHSRASPEEHHQNARQRITGSPSVGTAAPRITS